jgi:Intracellular proteinase inhibitor
MRPLAVFAALLFLAEPSWLAAQDQPAPKRGFLGRILHPFGSSQKIPEYGNPKLRGLALEIQLPPEPIKLAETRQLPVTVHLVNLGQRAAELSFPSDQRIEILLHDAAGRVVTRWSDNRAFQPTPATILVNPNEHLEYSETIATRELAPGKVFTVEVLVPAYPELDAKRKSIAAP